MSINIGLTWPSTNSQPAKNETEIRKNKHIYKYTFNLYISLYYQSKKKAGIYVHMSYINQR